MKGNHIAVPIKALKSMLGCKLQVVVGVLFVSCIQEVHGWIKVFASQRLHIFLFVCPLPKVCMHTHTQFLNNFPSFHPSRAFTNHFRCCLFIDNEMFAPWLFCFLAKVQTSHSSSGTSSSNQAMRFGEDPIRCIEYADTCSMTGQKPRSFQMSCMQYRATLSCVVWKVEDVPEDEADGLECAPEKMTADTEQEPSSSCSIAQHSPA